jgi:periplasmic protein TonB
MSLDMEYLVRLHLINKSQTMTSKEILQASLLEIVFEHRNKQYGAYTLRKFYSNRLSVALLLTLIVVFLACFLFRPPANGNVFADIAKDIVILSEVHPAIPEIPQPPVQPHAAAPHIKTPDITPPVIVPDNVFTNPLPALEDLEGKGMPNTGGNDGGDVNPGPSVNPVVSSVGPASEGGKTNEFHPLEMKPEFPGGDAAWMAFLSRWLQVPDELQPGEKKTVVVRFQVSEEGVVTNFEIIQSGGRSFDNEVMRVLKRMPKWKPAMQNNHKVATSFTQPVTFQSFEN